MNQALTIRKINELIEENERFLITAHERPDGDAAGSTLCLCHVLNDMGKTAVAYLEDPIPRHLTFLVGADKVLTELPDPDEFDAVFVLDCGEFSRVGKQADRLAGHPNLVNIDHHKSNDGYGSLSLFDPEASSTGELIWEIIEAGDLPVGKNAAMALYTAIYTDTTSFRNANSTPQSYRICGKLVARGADPVMVADEFYINQTESRVRLLGRAIASLIVEPGGKIAGVLVTQKDLDECQAGPDELEGFVEYPRSILGVQAAYLLREVSPQMVKGSLRSSNPVDVAEVAQSFGGGGHIRAAGLRTEGTLEQVRKNLVQKLTEAVNKT